METSAYFMGHLVRKTRQELGLNLKELSEVAHPSTLSKFERGLCSLGEDKLKHLFSILKIQMNEVPTLLKKLKQELSKHDFILYGIESMIDQGVYSLSRFKEAANYLDSQTSILYLKAKYYLVSNKLEKAEQYYQQVIDSKDHDYTYLYLNVIAAAYLDLCVIADKQNNFKLALEYVENGLHIFSPNGKRKYIEDALIYHKALLYLKIGKLNEAEQTLEGIWERRAEIGEVAIKTNIYKLKAIFYKRRGKYDEAINILEQALEIAASNSLVDIGFELWVELGDIAYARHLYDFSERAYQMALLSKNNLKSEIVLTNVHHSLARLYAKIGLQKKAEIEIQKAINNAECFKDIYKLTRSLFLHGKILKENNIDRAILTYRRAWDLSKTYDLKNLEYKILFHLIKLETNKETQQELMLRRLEIELQLEE